MLDPYIKTVVVYGASKVANVPSFSEVSYQAGFELAQNGYVVVYGGGDVGDMAKAARGALDAGGRVIAVIPQEFTHFPSPAGAELVIVPDFITRKATMRELSQVTVALPSGLGMRDELYEDMTVNDTAPYRSLDTLIRPIILVNHKGAFQGDLWGLRFAESVGYIGAGRMDMIHDVETPAALIAKLNELNKRGPIYARDLPAKHAIPPKALLGGDGQPLSLLG